MAKADSWKGLADARPSSGTGKKAAQGPRSNQDVDWRGHGDARPSSSSSSQKVRGPKGK